MFRFRILCNDKNLESSRVEVYYVRANDMCNKLMLIFPLRWSSVLSSRNFLGIWRKIFTHSWRNVCNTHHKGTSCSRCARAATKRGKNKLSLLHELSAWICRSALRNSKLYNFRFRDFLVPPGTRSRFPTFPAWKFADTSKWKCLILFDSSQRVLYNYTRRARSNFQTMENYRSFKLLKFSKNWRKELYDIIIK